MMQFDLIDRLEVKSHEGDMIKIVAEDDFGGYLNFKVEEKGKTFIITEQVNDLNEEYNVSKICAVQPVYTAYKIELPKKRRVELVVSEGNIDIINFNGQLIAKLEKGEINLEPFEGIVDLFLNIGNIKCVLKNTTIEAETNLGLIITDLEFENEVKASNSLAGFYQNQNNKLKIRSTNGNIHLK